MDLALDLCISINMAFVPCDASGLYYNTWVTDL